MIVVENYNVWAVYTSIQMSITLESKIIIVSINKIPCCI